MEQVCDYAVNSGLNIIVYFSSGGGSSPAVSLLSVASARWGSHFLGIYYSDEPGGRLLDSDMTFYNNTAGTRITKQPGGWIDIYSTKGNRTSDILYQPDGEINNNTSIQQNPEQVGGNQSNPQSNGTATIYTPIQVTTTYYPNGTIQYYSSTPQTNGWLTYQPNGTVKNQYGATITNAGSISQFEPYQQLWDSRPLQTYSEVADAYTTSELGQLSSIGNQSDVHLFTSDFGLYWFDYLGGYNTVFGELFGEQTDAVTLGLVRGAADLQGKSWGTMIEWGNRTSVTLQSGDQIYDELLQTYQDGGQYGIVFNYAPNSNSTNGLLQNEQFNALQRFWTGVVENSSVTNNVKGQDALVLPPNYGSGLRNSQDKMWGIWSADNNSQQVWNSMQAALSKYGSKLDIVFPDKAYPTSGRYQHVVYWNQTT